MLQDKIITQMQRDRFIQTVCESGIVWGLQSEEGFAVTGSNDYEDESGEPLPLICFWSGKALAKACAKEEWSGYEPVEISLGEFIETWCIGMANDNMMAGPDFDPNMHGFEIDPLELIVELAKELNAQEKTLVLQNYAHLNDLVTEVEKILNE